VDSLEEMQVASFDALFVCIVVLLLLRHIESDGMALQLLIAVAVLMVVKLTVRWLIVLIQLGGGDTDVFPILLLVITIGTFVHIARDFLSILSSA
jgi:hypothetical protein